MPENGKLGPRTRAVHLNDPEGWDVKIDRTTPWGNPFSHLDKSLAKWRVQTRAESIEAFQAWVLTSDDEEAAWIREHVSELQGKRLACWCKPRSACHGDVLAAMADGHDLAVQGSLDI